MELNEIGVVLILSSDYVIPHLLLHHHLVPPDPVLVVGGKAKTQGVSLFFSWQKW